MKKLGFGLMRLPLINDNDPSSIDFDKVFEMVDIFMKNGFNYFDTAHTYLKGNSEKAFRKALVDRYPRDSYIIADKLPIFNLTNSSQMQDIFDEQLERCGVDYFDYYMLHNVSTNHMKKFTDIDSFGFVRKKKREGKVKHIGISCHDSPEFLDRILNEHPEIEFVQLQINYLDWTDNNIRARDCYEVACKHDLPVIIMEPLKGGTLVDVPSTVKDMFNNYDEHDSVVSWAIRFNLSLDNVFMMLSGMKSVEDINENISIVDNFKPIDEVEKSILNKAVDIINDTIEIKCTSCNYCIEVCPQNINIPKYFDLYNKQKLLNHENSYSMYYNNYVSDSNHASPDKCIKCKQCMEVCPQNINIPNNLEKVVKTFDN